MLAFERKGLELTDPLKRFQIKLKNDFCIFKIDFTFTKFALNWNL